MYWTGIWEPHREALSKEVDLLRRTFGAPARVVSFSSGQCSRPWSSDRVIRLSGERWVLLRALAALLEPTTSVTHVVGEMHAWHLLRALGRRPIVFTVAIPGPPLDESLYKKVSVFAAESEALADALLSHGIPSSKVAVVYPGVDTQRFAPPPQRPDGPLRVVFASSPASPNEFGDRGITLLVEAARLAPDVEITLLWRQWGSVAAADAALAALNPPPNVSIRHGDLAEIADAFREADATVWLGAAGRGKSCPNSVVEGLACGCAAIVSDHCGIANLIARSEAGVSVAPTPVAVAAAMRRVAAARGAFAANARRLAQERFSLDTFVSRYRELYGLVEGPLAATV
jgi:glycosyltransferase involved in cell wall biosynthesis